MVESHSEQLADEERSLAAELWNTLMFAPSRFELEKARVALNQTPLPVQLAVMGSITQLWLQECEPQSQDNPFLV